MDTDVLNNKLESLAKCVKRIESKMPQNLEQLENDIDMQDIIVVNLERAVQICVDIASHILLDYEQTAVQSMAENFTALAKHSVIPAELAESLAHAVGFRNIAVHQYQSLNWAVVYSIITKNLTDFRSFAGYVSDLIFTK
ncbi:MAG: DUF86 domain-containing protein [Treponema sp.]|nr:DUF86 domain-containing protein [Treponema sp.]